MPATRSDLGVLTLRTGKGFSGDHVDTDTRAWPLASGPLLREVLAALPLLLGASQVALILSRRLDRGSHVC